MKTPKNYYENVKEKVDKKLSALLESKKPSSLYEPCDYILKGTGKRLRPALIVLSAKTVGGNPVKCYNASVAVELLHNFTLVHDDIMDNADKRRGRETLHKLYDLSTAILAGDSLIAIAYQELLKDCKQNTNEIINEFTQGIKEVCEGQSLDKEFEVRDDVTLNEYKTMITKKTAALFSMCCSIGGYIGNGNRKQIHSLKNFGKNLGIAFQIQDDLLDLMGSEKKLGKKIGGDLIEGKKTYLFLKAYEKAKGSDRKLLKNFIKNNGIKSSEVSKYKVLFEKLDVIGDTKRQIDKFITKSLNSLKDINDNSGKEYLTWLANSLIGRTK